MEDSALKVPLTNVKNTQVILTILVKNVRNVKINILLLK